ncbi:MAG: sulfatase, partial [Acidobacteriota bacterium]
MRPLDTQPATPFWPAVLLATAALLTACSEPPPSSPSTGSVPTAVSAGDGTPVILISVDTLRSDRLPAYGYSAGSTPAIDALRADGVLFERAWSPVPLTLPAHVTMLTGLLPNAHGVRDNVGYTVQLDLGADLVGRLNRLGYRTGAGISAYPLSRQVGFGDGFEHFDDTTFRPELGPEGLERAGDQTLAWSQPWLSEVSAAGAPFFFFFHLYEPHAPYEPPPPFAERFDDPYDGEIAAADAIVGQLLETLRDTGVYDRALVILVSDHGEGLGAHGEEEHGLLLYREALQIPLIVKFPEGR